MLVAIVASVILTACGEDYQDDIDKLNERHAGIEQRVTNIESQVRTFNSQLEALKALSVAVEQNFYITSVETITDGYQLTLSNGRIIVLQNGPDNLLIPTPAVSITQINGFFYWTLNGMVLTDDDGRPIRSTDVTPVVKYDHVTLQWLISIDGGVTFQTVNAYTSIVINDQVLLQILNTYVSRYSTTIISQDILYQIISTYIQQNYSLLFDVKKLHQTIYSYVHDHYGAVFSYELLEKIFNQYNYEYYTSQVDVDLLIDIILSFIREHQEVFVNNDVLYEIFTNYMTFNKTTIFDDKLLLEVFNNFVQNNENYIDVDLLREVIYNYIDQHQDVIVNNELILNLLLEYVQNNYVQIFDQQILVQLFSKYMTLNFSTIFNETLIRDIINTYVQNNYNTFIDNETIRRIINNYITENETTVISRDVLVDIVTKYFQVNYNIFVRSIDIENIINTYVESHQTTLFDIDILQEVVLNYVRVYYNEVFNYSFLEKIITNYFNNTTFINEYISRYTGVISDIQVTDDYCEITYNNNQKVRLVVFDEYARLRDRVQSIVVLHNGTGRLDWLARVGNSTIIDYFLPLKYKVTPASIVGIIKDKMLYGEVTMELITTDGNGNISNSPVYEAEFYEGTISINFHVESIENIKAVALHVKENRVGGNDIITEFTAVGKGKQKGYLDCPDSHHPHMIDLGLPSGTLWACCNLGASSPYENGDYFAYGETRPKGEYSWETFFNVDWWPYHDDIATSDLDAASMQWGDKWRMPTIEQWMELKEYSEREYETGYNSSYLPGRIIVKGSNGGQIRLPYASYQIASEKMGGFYYWSSSCVDPHDFPKETEIRRAWSVSGEYTEFFKTPVPWYWGIPVRPVAK